jgi:hypothetical protein
MRGGRQEQTGQVEIAVQHVRLRGYKNDGDMYYRSLQPKQSVRYRIDNARSTTSCTPCRVLHFLVFLVRAPPCLRSDDLAWSFPINADEGSAIVILPIPGTYVVLSTPPNPIVSLGPPPTGTRSNSRPFSSWVGPLSTSTRAI